MDPYAFGECLELTSITIPDSLTSIGENAFYACVSLTSITIPDNVTSIGNYSFLFCYSLKKIKVGANNSRYTDVSGILFNKGKTSLVAFPADKTVTNYSIPEGVTSIGYSAFDSCENLRIITIPDSVKRIGQGAFWTCKGLENINIPEGVTSIEPSTFAECEALTSITIPDSVSRIGNEAFQDCSKLTSIIFLGNAPTLGSSVFNRVAANAIVNHFSGATGYTSNGFRGTTVQPTLSYKSSGNDVTITDCNIQVKGELVIPSSIGGKPVVSIDNEAFRGCKDLTKIIIPASISSIGDRAFSGYIYLTEIEFLANAPTRLGVDVFDLLPGEARIISSPNALGFSDTFGGLAVVSPVLFTYQIIGSAVTITDCDETASGAVVIPSTIEGKPVTSIGESAFRYCERLTKITIPDSVTRIEKQAFSDCEGLNSVTIGNSVISIGESAFYCCISLMKVNIPEGVTNIGYSAFRLCENLGSITISDSVINIGDRAFRYCTSLASIILPENLTIIGEQTFRDCVSLTSVTISDSVISIGERAFLLCTSLTSITFLGNAPSVGSLAFSEVPTNAKVFIYEGTSGFSPEDGKFGGFSLVVQKNPFAGDTDKDGWKDETEVLFGSSPDNAKSVPAFKLKMNVLGGDQLELLFPGEEGDRYSVQTSDDMKTWLSLEKLIIGQGDTISERFSISGGLGFYRIREEQ